MGVSCSMHKSGENMYKMYLVKFTGREN